jgi:hypothetical protein
VSRFFLSFLEFTLFIQQQQQTRGIEVVVVMADEKNRATSFG